MNKSTILSGLCAISIPLAIANPAQASTQVVDSQAQQKPIPIKVIAGRASVINFRNNERISFVMLSDRSRVVYSLNAPPDSGEARSLFLRQIKPLNFPGETTHYKPNLHVIAIDAQGNQHNYEFIIDSSSANDTNVDIISEKFFKPPTNVIETELGAATPYDILNGLKIKLNNGEIPRSSPLVMQTSEAIATTLNSNQTLLEVAQEFQVPLSVLVELGRVGLIEKTKTQIAQNPRSRSQEVALIPTQKSPSEILVPKPPSPIAKTSPVNSLFSQFEIETDLGTATKKDVKFGLSVLLERETITNEDVTRIEKLLEKDLNSLDKVNLEEIKRVARFGLAFATRLKLTGSIH